MRRRERKVIHDTVKAGKKKHLSVTIKESLLVETMKFCTIFV